jgi:geranylgeranyl diphosphate synthase type I
MTTVAVLPPALRDARELVVPALRAAVQRLDPVSRAVAAYHLGWTDGQGRPVEAGGGKAVRPALALLSARAAGAPAATGVPGAVAVELVHNFSLLHDDLMDGDVERRHRPTAWVQWGQANAVLTGDAMLALASRVLLEPGTREGADAALLLADATLELVRGQAQDVAFETRAGVPLDECLDMAGGKTGALLSASAAIGAVLAGAPAPLVAALAEHGAEVGLAFQLVDDLLGIWGEAAVTGKPVLSDLRTRKKSLPVTYAVCSGTSAGHELAAWLASPGPDDEDRLRHAAGLVERAGGREWAAEEARARLVRAERALSRVALPQDVAAELTALAGFLGGRQS